MADYPWMTFRSVYECRGESRKKDHHFLFDLSIWISKLWFRFGQTFSMHVRISTISRLIFCCYSINDYYIHFCILFSCISFNWKSNRHTHFQGGVPSVTRCIFRPYLLTYPTFVQTSSGYFVVSVCIHHFARNDTEEESHTHSVRDRSSNFLLALFKIQNKMSQRLYPLFSFFRYVMNPNTC